MGEVTIVIAQRDHLELTEGCIGSLREWESEKWPVIVVDDGSADAAGLDRLEECCAVEVVRMGEQRGVTAAWNAGARRVETEAVVFLNNDVVVGGPWVERLAEPLRCGDAVVSGVRWREERAVGRGLFQSHGTAAQFLEGWCFAMRAASWRALGGFDERFRVYFGDTDLMMRARRLGALQVVEGLPLVHLGHRTARDRRCLRDRWGCWEGDREWFVRKWGGMRDEG